MKGKKFQKFYRPVYGNMMHHQAQKINIDLDLIVELVTARIKNYQLKYHRKYRQIKKSD